jgi:hypothetical protein
MLTPKKPAPTAPYVYTDLSEETELQDESFESNGKWFGLCRKDSIHSIEDFRKTVENDQVLKAHFAGFQWDKAVVKKLEKPLYANVYFRKNDVIIRTKKALKLPAGDEYITDGTRRVRTHCCNDYEEAPPPLVESFMEESGGGAPASKIAAVPGAVGSSGVYGASGWGVGGGYASSGGGGGGLFGSSSSGGGDSGCTGPGCSPEPGCTGPECNRQPPCTGPSCNPEPPCTGPSCKPYETPEPGTGFELAACVAVLAAGLFLRRRLTLGNGTLD